MLKRSIPSTWIRRDAYGPHTARNASASSSDACATTKPFRGIAAPTPGVGIQSTGDSRYRPASRSARISERHPTPVAIRPLWLSDESDTLNGCHRSLHDDREGSATMTDDDFLRFLGRPEGENLDFKEDGYDLKRSREAFLKDVLAMANTPRDDAAHIVFGVRWEPDAGCTVLGLKNQLDDAMLQDQIRSGHVQPIPRFTYSPFEFEGKQVGVLEVPVATDGPYTPVTNLAKLHAGAIYYRRGVGAFFVPAKSGFHFGRDENRLVDCYLGFSYDGPRAWDVRVANS